MSEYLFLVRHWSGNDNPKTFLAATADCKKAMELYEEKYFPGIGPEEDIPDGLRGIEIALVGPVHFVTMHRYVGGGYWEDE